MLRARCRREDGFTLIEILVVVLVLGILVAIALPTFLGSRDRAQDSAAKATVRSGFTAGRIHFSTDLQGYLTVTEAGLRSIDGSLGWTPDGSTPSTGPTEVSWDNTGGILTLATFSKAGRCFFLRDDPPNSTTYATLDGVTTADCTADNPAPVFVGSW